ncbi:hypothetical protein ABTO78_20370, partial [Acinetobacter baumannii]
NGGEASLKRVLARGAWSEVEWFNDAAGWRVESTGEALAVVGPAGERATGRLAMPGMHNANNALAAALAARHAGVRPEQALASLGEFVGIRR